MVIGMEPKVVLAKIDATVETVSANKSEAPLPPAMVGQRRSLVCATRIHGRYDVSGFPTIIFFKSGHQVKHGKASRNMQLTQHASCSTERAAARRPLPQIAVDKMQHASVRKMQQPREGQVAGPV
jgi:hypothetical protein